MKKNVIAIIMALTILLTSSAAYASVSPYETNYSKTVFTIESQSFQVERIVSTDSIIVRVLDLKTGEEAITERRNSDLFLNGQRFDTASFYTQSTMRHNSSRGEWGPWIYGSESFNTGGLTAIAIIAILMQICPWVGSIATIAQYIVGRYDRVTVTWMVRYKQDGDLYCYERVTRFYGDGVLFWGPITDSGCSYQ